MSVYMLDALSQLPDGAFSDDDLFAAELALFFRSRWCFAFHVGRVAVERKWVCLRVGGREVIFVKDDDGQMRAFPNRCLHKGERFLEAGKSACSALLRCHHHGWVYRLDGHLIAGPGFDLSARARSPVLPTVSVLRRGPFVMIGPEPMVGSTQVAPEIPPVQVPPDETLESHSVLETRANWKLIARILCERGWAYLMPHLLGFRDRSGLVLARLEPLAATRTLVDVEVAGSPFRSDEGIGAGTERVRDAAGAAETMQPQGSAGGGGFELGSVLAVLEEGLAPPPRGERYFLSDEV